MIESAQKVYLNRAWHSSYHIGQADGHWLIKTARPHMDEFYYHHGNKDQGWIHYNIMRDYLREFKPTLWQWFNETKTPFGGLVGNNFHDGKLPQFVNSA